MCRLRTDLGPPCARGFSIEFGGFLAFLAVFFAIFYNFHLRAKLLSWKTFILMRWNFLKIFFLGSDPLYPLRAIEFGGFFTFLAVFSRFSTILILEQNFCHKKPSSWCVETFSKFFFGSDPPPPPGGYFKDFQLFFVILGFKWHKIGHKMKSLSQKSYPVASWNIIIKKNPRPPQWAPRSHSWLNLSNLFAFFEFFLQKLQITLPLYGITS